MMWRDVLGISLSVLTSYSFRNGGYLLLVSIISTSLHKIVRICKRPNADTYLVGRLMASNGLTGRISIRNSPGTSEMNGPSSSSFRAILVLDKMVVGSVAKWCPGRAGPWSFYRGP